MSLLKTVNRFADRGADAERAVQKYLTEWGQYPAREWSRLVDSKAAGRTIKAAAADFEFYMKVTGAGPRGDETKRYFGLIEVKETKHDYRLEKKRVTQLARLRKRANAGGLCIVLVYHSTTNFWRGLSMPYMLASGDLKGSWDMTDLPAFRTVQEALHYAATEVF